jgi:hypothetical protein
MAYVYQHIRKDKNQPFYIGIGSDMDFYRANKLSERNEIWNRISEKTEIVVEILHQDIDWEIACQIEKDLIKYYGRINNNTGILSNMTDGGEGTFNKVITDETKFLLGTGNRGKKRSEESRIKQSLSTIGVKKSENHRENIRLARLGKTHSEESKIKMSLNSKGRSSWNKGKSFSTESKEKMSASKKGKRKLGENSNAKLVLNVLTGIFYTSLKEAANSIEMGYSYFKRKMQTKKINFIYV